MTSHPHFVSGISQSNDSAHWPNGAETFSRTTRELDVMKRDRFELLNAYLDGEVTSEERHLVDSWLSSDPTTQCLYRRLLQLRRGMQTVPVESDCDWDALVSGVVHSVNHRLRLTYMAGVGVIALGILASLSGVFSPRPSLVQWAAWEDSTPEGETLQLALDQPVFPIPKAPTAVMTQEMASPTMVNPLEQIQSEL